MGNMIEQRYRDEAERESEYAKRILKNYFRLAIGEWDSDYDAEIDWAVDSMIAAAKAEVEAENIRRLSVAFDPPQTTKTAD